MDSRAPSVRLSFAQYNSYYCRELLRSELTYLLTFLEWPLAGPARDKLVLGAAGVSPYG